MRKKLLILLTTIFVFSIALAGCGADSKSEKSSKEAAITKTEGNTDSNINKNFFFTANEGGSVSKIDSSTNQVVETIKVDGTVHNVQVSPNGKVIGITVVPKMNHNQNEADEDSTSHSEGHGDDESKQNSDMESMEMNGSAMFYDIESSELLKEIKVGNHPAHIDFTSNGKYALVTNNEDNTVSVIDIENYEVIKTVNTGKGPHGFRISSDDKFAYIANMGEDTVSVINLETFKEDKKITVGSAPVTTAISSNGKLLVATLNAENKVAIIDLETEQAVKLDVGKGPAQVYIQADNKFAYVANQGTEDNPSDTVTKIDLVNKKVAATIKTGNGSHGVVTSPDNQFTYVTNMYENTVSVIDNEGNKVITTINVDKVPNGISIME